MTDERLVPELEGIPEDDFAEADDAEIVHSEPDPEDM